MQPGGLQTEWLVGSHDAKPYEPYATCEEIIVWLSVKQKKGLYDITSVSSVPSIVIIKGMTHCDELTIQFSSVFCFVFWSRGVVFLEGRFWSWPCEIQTSFFDPRRFLVNSQQLSSWLLHHYWLTYNTDHKVHMRWVQVTIETSGTSDWQRGQQIISLHLSSWNFHRCFWYSLQTLVCSLSECRKINLK